jgi:hypothetical protein
MFIDLYFLKFHYVDEMGIIKFSTVDEMGIDQIGMVK